MNKTSATIVRTLLLGTSCLSAFGLGAAQGQPTGGSVVYGSASITNKNANNTVIDQKTGKAIINWNSFSIGAGGTVTFNQPGSSSIALNRVLGGGVSSIDGKLNANGQVWIINQNGIMFGAGARINVGGLIATTSDIANGDFAAGNYDFSGSSGAAVVNQGTIRTAKGGAAVLSGASVSNRGLIQADAGTVVLGGASAFTVDFVGDGLIKYAITAPAGKADNGQAGVSNSGTLAAAGGRVIMTARAAASVQDAVVNNTGMISATSAKLVNGEVVLDGGDGDVNAGGTIDASGAQRGQTGGTVAITGRNVTVADNTRIDASGDAGGGTVKIGGDLHGAGPLADAANVTVGHAAIRADATRTGKGGTLVVWSNGITDFSGIFSAKGGALGGDGGFAETSGHTLNIAPEAKVDTTAPRGRTGTWLLDPDYIVITAGEGSGTQLDGSGTLALGADPGATDYISPTTIVNALATTNVTLEAAQDIEVDSPVLYASGNALSLMAQGNIYAFASIQNSQATGGGAINLVAGWDGVTAPGAILSTPGAYGNAGPDSDRGEILIDSENADALIGSASGTTTVAGFEAVLFADDGGNAQIGYHGAGGGDINVVTTGDAAVVGQSPGGDPAHYAMIGNGALDGAVTGQVTGNIFVSIGGEFDLETLPSGYSCDCQDGAVMPAPGTGATAAAPLAGVAGRTVGIGNAGAPSGVPPTGSVVFLAGSVDDSDDENGGFGNSILADLAYGDVTVGQTGTATPVQLSGEQLIDTAHNFTLLAAGDIELDGAIENAGSGAITVVAGWDGIYDPKRIGVAGTYGNNDGTITIGGANAQGDSALGTASGALSLYGANLNVTAVNGYAQVGYHGAGGGAIAVTLTGDLTIQGGADAADAAQLGNGSLLGDITGNVGGNITINAGGQTVFENGDSGLSWLGNAAGSGGIETGDVTLLTVGGFFRADFVTADLGTTAGTGGNVFIGFTDPTVTPLYIGGFDYSSAHDFTFAGAGSMNVTGAVQNAGTGAVTLVTGWDGHTVGSAAQLQAANAYGLGDTFLAVGNADQYQDIAIGSAGGLTTILTHDLTIAPLAGFYAQVGYHGTGGGDIHIVAPGALTLTGGDAAHDYAMIGNGSLNGDVTGAVTGNLDIRVGGQTSLDTAEGLSNAWIGNLSTAAHGGSVVFVSGTFENTQTPSAMFASDLTGGDVTFALTDPASDAGLDIDLVYNSPYTLNLLVGGNVGIEANLQNGGSGAINVVAGWDGTTLDPAHFLDAGVFGNGGASLYIGGTAAAGNASVGSAGGVTTLAGANVILDGANGYAQAGFHGTGSGAVIVDATGAIALSGGSAADYAQIGSGATFGSNAGSGDVGLTANSITGAPNTAVAAANLAATLTGQGGAIGAATLPLTIAANTLALTTTGGSAYLASPGSGLTLAGVSLNGGSFSLAAGGAVGQTGAILAAQLAVSTTSGAIALTNAANAVVGQVQFGGPASIGFANSLNINLGAVSAGGDLLLLSKGNVNFAGSVQSAGGAITAVAGWNGTTTDPSQFGAAGAFGNNAGSITIGGTGARGAIAVGSQSGATSLYAANVNVVGAVGNAQLGFHGTGGGAIKVLASGSVTLTSGSGAATIGNGSPGTDVTGAVTGDIDIRAASAVAFNGTSGQTWIGNRTAGTGGGDRQCAGARRGLGRQPDRLRARLLRAGRHRRRRRHHRHHQHGRHRPPAARLQQQPYAERAQRRRHHRDRHGAERRQRRRQRGRGLGCPHADAVLLRHGRRGRQWRQGRDHRRLGRDGQYRDRQCRRHHVDLRRQPRAQRRERLCPARLQRPRHGRHRGERLGRGDADRRRRGRPVRADRQWRLQDRGQQ